MSKKVLLEPQTIKDHSVSGEIFNLAPDQDLQLYRTTPVPPELERYYQSEDYISHTDSKRSLFDRIYHIARRQAIKMKLSIIKKYYPGATELIDIGAGTGEFLSAAGKNGYKSSGIEPSAKARGIAERKGCNFYDDLSQIKNNSVDVVTMWHVLEHVPDVNGQMAELRRILKPGGSAIIAVPNYRSFDAHHYGKFWAAYDVPRHLWHFSKHSINLIAANTGFTVVAVRPMWLDSFYVSLLSEKYRSGRTNFLMALFVGLKSNLKAIKSGEFSSLIYVLKSE